MKVYPTNSLRTVALVSHQGAGKTSLVEAMLFNAGVTTRIGETQQGNTISDFDEEEIRRGLSISTSLIPLEVSGIKLNILDTPGYTDFQGEVINAVNVSDLALLLIDASSGVEVGSEIYWGYADQFNVPRMVVISKTDRDMARQPQVLIDELTEIFQARFVPIQLPVGLGGGFKGVVDLLDMKARLGAKGAPEDIPADVKDAAEEARVALMEAAAESDDELLEKYFEEGTLSDDEVWRGVKAGVAKGLFVPVVFTAATANVGAAALTDLLAKLAPPPTNREFTAQGAQGDETLCADDSGPLALYVYKTTADPFVGRLTFFRVISGQLKADSRYYNHSRGEEERFGPLYVMRGKEQMTIDTLHSGDIGAVAKLAQTVTGDTLGDKGHPVRLPSPEFPKPVYAVAVTPATQADSTKMGPTLSRLSEEDPTLNWRQDPNTHEAVLEGMGDVHADVAIRRAAQFGVHLETHIPKVPYRETVTKSFTDSYRHKKQSGGAGQFGEVHLRIEPGTPGAGLEFVNAIVGGAISQSFIPSIEKGIRVVMEQGVIAGYPVVDVKVAVIDGKMHPVDSKPIAFEIAGRECFKKVVEGAAPVLMEPVMNVKVTVPETNMGDVIGDMTSRRGQVLGTESISGKAIITVAVPLAEIMRYSNDLRSFTQGRGVYTMSFSHYAAVPSHIAQEIIAKSKKEHQEA